MTGWPNSNVPPKTRAAGRSRRGYPIVFALRALAEEPRPARIQRENGACLPNTSWSAQPDAHRCLT